MECTLLRILDTIFAERGDRLVCGEKQGKHMQIIKIKIKT
jgi:hypothetical protein